MEGSLIKFKSNVEVCKGLPLYIYAKQKVHYWSIYVYYIDCVHTCCWFHLQVYFFHCINIGLNDIYHDYWHINFEPVRSPCPLASEMKQWSFLIPPVPVKGCVYSSAGDTITKIAYMHVRTPVDSSCAVRVWENVAQLAWQANSSIVLIV